MIGIGLVNIDQAFLAGDIGYDYIELFGKKLMSFSEREFEDALSTIREAGLPVLGINAYCSSELIIAGPGFDRQRASEYAAILAKRAALLGTRYIGIGSPMSRTLPLCYPREKAILELRDFLMVTSEQFRKYDIVVCLEALADCYCNFINYTAEAYEIIKSLDSEYIKLVLDTYNMEMMGETVESVFPMLDEVVHLHISDDDGDPHKRSFLRPDKEKTHRSRIEALIKNGYQGNITLEIDIPVDKERAEETLSILNSSLNL